jgi:alpha-beta hydrolase superfamily lysophospholipase
MSIWQITLTSVAALLTALVGLRLALQAIAWKAWFGTKPNGSLTPKDYGLIYEEYWIAVKDRKLQAWFVRAPTRGSAPRAMLLFQGGNDVISELGPLQKYLFDHHISSLAFDFTGNGRSTGQPSVETLTEDGLAAFQKLQELVGAETRVYAWGYSSGTARLLAALNQGQVKLDGVVLMGPFTTSRALMLHHMHFLPKGLGALFIPEYWNNVAMLQQLTVPVLIVHSRADEAVPFAHGEILAQAGQVPIRLRAVDGLKHNDCWNPLHEAYWLPVFDFMEHGS